MAVEIGLSAAIVGFREGAPALYARNGELPAGSFDPRVHRTFEQAVREWVAERTGLSPGYVEQLYTFGDRGRHSLGADAAARHVVSVGYVALARPEAPSASDWWGWYDLFPWEDWRNGPPPVVRATIRPALDQWAAGSAERRARVALNFGDDDPSRFADERALDRYELLYEAGLVEEAVREGRHAQGETLPGRAMLHDHRRIAATAMTRLRSKLRYRPVIFQLMPEAFTLSDLQRAAEAIAGRTLHTQNFRRLVESAGLVERTGATASSAKGRPAALFRFRREVVNERPATGLRLGSR